MTSRRRSAALVIVFACTGAAIYSARARPVPRPKLVKERVLVPAGPAVLGANDGALDERPRRRAVLPAFRIDRTEVTRAMYAQCVAARKCAPVVNLDADVDPAAVPDGDLPVTFVSWHEARAFCRFAGGRLPGEAEWEKAARGAEGRTYPWGDELSCERANWGNFADEGPCAGTNPGAPAAVGARPQSASPYGAVDLAGNVWEWVEDRYPAQPDRRMVKGGSCCSYFVPPRAANRNGWAPEHRDGDLGFRCVSR